MSENNAMCDMYQNLFDMAKEGNFDEFCAAIDQFADGVQNQDFRKPPKFKVGDYVTVPPDTHLTRHIGRVYTVLGVYERDSDYFPAYRVQYADSSPLLLGETELIFA